MFNLFISYPIARPFGNTFAEMMPWFTVLPFLVSRRYFGFAYSNIGNAKLGF